MSYPWKNLSPKDGYALRRISFLSNVDQNVLTLLYQPLIGRDAFSLYMTWWSETERTGKGIKEGLLADVLTIQSMGIPEFFQARSRLEALGLVKTFIKKDQNHYVYELHPPLSAERFLADDILQLLLLAQIGEQQFERVKEQFLLPKWNRQGYEEITRSFPDVYQFNWREAPGNSLSAINDQLSEKYESEEAQKEVVSVDIVQASFDWTFFLTHVSSQFLTQKSLTENKKTIETLHMLYGIDELKMARFVLESADAVSGQVQPEKLKTLIHRQYRKPVFVTGDTEKTDNAKEDEKRFAGYSKQDTQLLRVSEKRNPADFLISIKNQKGGFITQVEQWTLEDIVSRSGLSASVINILVHYILVVKDSAVFERNLAYKIANDWAQNQVKTPQQAMEKVRQLYETNEKRSQPNKNATNRKPQYQQNKNTFVRKETLPEWAKEGNEKGTPSDRPLSEEEQKAFKDRLKKIRGYRKEGDE